jgi:hypothetical protein
MNRLTRSAALLAALFLFTLAQAGDGEIAPRRIASPKRIPDVVAPQSSPAGEPVPTASIPKTVRRAVITDAAKRFEVAEESVVLARAQRITWDDGALGCPTPGGHYAPTRVSGFRIAATTASGEMIYHTDTLGNVVTCDPLPRQHPRRAAPVRATEGGRADTRLPVRDAPGR